MRGGGGGGVCVVVVVCVGGGEEEEEEGARTRSLAGFRCAVRAMSRVEFQSKPDQTSVNAADNRGRQAPDAVSRMATPAAAGGRRKGLSGGAELGNSASLSPPGRCGVAACVCVRACVCVCAGLRRRC